jgi:hypothetical protein
MCRRFIRVIATVLFAVAIGQICASREPLELKGDRLGESVAQFTVRHPNASCKLDENPDIRTCYQRKGVSLADLPTLGSTCDPPSTPYWQDVCAMVGLYAKFSSDKLTLLTYTFWVNGAVSDVQVSTSSACDAFKEKYGKPDVGDGQHGCSWFAGDKDGKTLQFLSVSTENSEIGGMDAVFTSVMLADSVPSRDI